MFGQPQVRPFIVSWAVRMFADGTHDLVQRNVSSAQAQLLANFHFFPKIFSKYTYESAITKYIIYLIDVNDFFLLFNWKNT